MADVFEARVVDGRLVLDEPTDLPEGEVVYLQQVDAAEAAGDMSDEEREDLFQALDEAIESVNPPEDTVGDDTEADGPPTVPQSEAGTRE